MRLVDLVSKSGFSTNDSILHKAVFQLDSGITLMVDERMNWERVAG